MTDAAEPARIDAHQHFWDIESGRYDWPTPAEAAIHRTFRPSDLEPELRASGIDRTIVVQAVDTLDDTDSMLAAAAANPWIAGVVGWVPLEDVARAEAALAAWSEAPLRGVRHLIHHEADPDWLVNPRIQPGLELLARRGLAFDVVAVFPDHLGHVPTIADRHPNLTLVIDHLANPPIRGDGWDAWRAGLEEAARRPNVVAKLSGLDTAAGPGWTRAELRPSIDVALEAFGPDRLLFGSDWPVCRMFSTYGEVVGAAIDAVADLTTAERRAILGETAARVYGLDGHQPPDRPA